MWVLRMESRPSARVGSTFNFRATSPALHWFKKEKPENTALGGYGMGGGSGRRWEKKNDEDDHNIMYEIQKELIQVF